MLTKRYKEFKNVNKTTSEESYLYRRKAQILYTKNHIYYAMNL